MAETTHCDKKIFEFKGRTVSSGQTEVLEVDVKNITDAQFDGFLLIELKLPAELAAPRLRQASLNARTSIAPANMATLAGVVTAAGGWSVWAINDPNDHIVVIRVFNGVDQLTAASTETNAPLAAGAVLKLSIPLAAGAVKTKFEMEYGYQAGEECETRVDGSLDLTPSQLAAWTPPTVSLTCKHTSPTMIPPGDEVVIEWKVEKGIAATLRGPLPGGNSELTLSRDRTSNYRIEAGSLTTYAVGPATYILDAEVKGPDGQPNVQVVRTLTLDIYSADKYGRLTVTPTLVLPNGKVKLNWVVWGVEKASLSILNRSGLKLTLTEQTLSRTYNGSGTWHVHASDSKEVEKVNLLLTNAPESKGAKTKEIQVVKWQPTTTKPVFAGRPVALAMAEGNMALLTSEGLYTAHIGTDDSESSDPDFVKSAATAKGWHALAAYGSSFVLLRQTDGGDFVLELYNGNGQRINLPSTLPEDFKAVARRGEADFDLVGFGKRVYVVAEAPAHGRWARVAYSLNLEAEEPARREGLLAALTQYRLVTFDNALYAYHRGTGRMLRFKLTKEGGLDKPRRAAAAVNAKGESMIKTGLPVAVGPVLVVLDPAAYPLFDPLKNFAFLNVVSFVPTGTPSRKPSEIPQDIVYKPQHDEWVACGHGLKVKAGAVAAYRGGAAERIWVLMPDGEMQKLFLETGVELFAPDFIDKLHSQDLPPLLDAAREFTLVNQSGIDLVPLDAACSAAGLEHLGADGPAELAPAPENLPNGSNRRFTLSYSKTDTTAVRLRFMVANPPGVRYLLEMTLAGEGLTRVTTVFKRLSSEGQLADVPDTSAGHPVGADSYTLTPPGGLLRRKRLIIGNATTHDLNVSPREGTTKVPETAWVEVAYNTPDLKITVPEIEKIGKLTVNFDIALPFGIETSPGTEPQRMMMRVNTDDLNMLDVDVNILNTYFTSIGGGFELYDKRFVPIGKQTEDVCSLRVGMKKKKELDGVRLGDAAVSPDRKAIFLALARPDNVKQVRVVRYDLGGGAMTEKSYETQGNIYSVPNALTVSEMYYDVMFAEPMRYTAMHNFGTPWSQIFDGFAEVVALASSRARNVFNVGKRLVRDGYENRPVYFLSVAHLGNNREETPLANIAYPVGVPPLAVSPDGRTAAVADHGGLILVDMRVAADARKAQSIRIPNTREPAHVVFSHDGDWVFCAHATRVMSGGGPRRAVAGRDVTVTRVRISDQIMRQTVGLPNVEGNFALTANTKQSFGVNVTSKEQVALSLAVSPDDKNLFVSLGNQIMKIALDTYTLQQWRATVELPCRLVCVNQATRDAYTVYALGSHYVGDGTKVDEYKTHLYFIPAPVR